MYREAACHALNYTWTIMLLLTCKKVQKHLKVGEWIGFLHQEASKVDRIEASTKQAAKLGCRLEHPLSSVPVLFFPKDWWHLEVTMVWQFEALISGLILIASWSTAPPIVLSNPSLCHWSPCTEWAFPFGMLGSSLQPFSFPPWAAWPLG